MSKEFEKSSLNKVKRGSHKGKYDRESIYSILDEAEICNIAFLFEGRAMVQPINFGRDGDKIYLHGSHKNRMTQSIIDSVDISLSVTHLDSMKLTRSAYHHSVNFRSAVVFGKTRELTDNDEKLQGLKAIINHFVADRWDNCRLPNEKELQATRLVEISIESASAKIADGPPEDKKEDLDSNFWSGEIAVRNICEFPKAVDDLKEEIEIPQHVIDFYNKRKA